MSEGNWRDRSRDSERGRSQGRGPARGGRAGGPAGGREGSSSGASRGFGQRGDRPSYGRDDRGPRQDREGRPSYGRDDRGPRQDREGRPSYGRDDRGPRQDRGGRPSYGRDERPRRDEQKPRSGGQSWGQGPRTSDRPRDDERERRPRDDERERRPRGPQIPEEITGDELDRDTLAELKTLGEGNFLATARHVVAAGQLLEADPDAALEHAEAAVRRGGRVAAVREAMGLVRYHRGEWSEALAEFRTARRLSGKPDLLPYMVDCERAMGRLDRALALSTSDDASRLDPESLVELTIVVSGIRRDMGQPDASVLTLQRLATKDTGKNPWSARLAYAYADALLGRGDEAEARAFFEKAAAWDEDGTTDAPQRLAELDGVDLASLEQDDDIVDLADGAEDEGPEEVETGSGAAAPAEAGDAEAVDLNASAEGGDLQAEAGSAEPEEIAPERVPEPGPAVDAEPVGTSDVVPSAGAGDQVSDEQGSGELPLDFDSPASSDSEAQR